MKKTFLTMLITMFFVAGSLSAQEGIPGDDVPSWDKDVGNSKIQKRKELLDALFDKELTAEEDAAAEEKKMMEELARLMKEAEKDMNEKIVPLMDKLKSHEKLQELHQGSVSKLGRCVVLAKELSRKKQEKPSKKPKPKPGKKEGKKKQPGKGKGGKKPGKPSKPGNEAAKTDDMTSGSVQGGSREELKDRERGKNAFGKLPPKEREAMKSRDGARIESKYGRIIREYFQDNE